MDHDDHRRLSVAHRARTEAGKRQANEERLRIARELHDVVAHHMSLISVQAGVAPCTSWVALPIGFGVVWVLGIKNLLSAVAAWSLCRRDVM